MTKAIKERLEYLRGEILAGRDLSWLETAELQSLAQYIEPGDTLLLEWAGVPEFPGVCPSCGEKTANGYAIDAFNPCKYCK